MFLLVIGVVSSCKKEDYDAAKQLAKDDQLIQEFIAKNNIPAQKDDNSGIYYQILNSGSGDAKITTNSQITVSYEGRLLNGSVFDKSSGSVTFILGGLIQGWQIGIPKIQKGGKIRLILPSAQAYKNQPRTGIPANSVLDFTINLINVQ